MANMERRKMSYYGQISRHNSMAKTITIGQIGGTGKKGCPKRYWMSNVTMWTNKNVDELLTMTNYKDGLKRNVTTAK